MHHCLFETAQHILATLREAGCRGTSGECGAWLSFLKKFSFLRCKPRCKTSRRAAAECQGCSPSVCFQTRSRATSREPARETTQPPPVLIERQLALFGRSREPPGMRARVELSPIYQQSTRRARCIWQSRGRACNRGSCCTTAARERKQKQKIKKRVRAPRKRSLSTHIFWR